ncbi:YheC/YheD family endospore coat-associated protein [Thermaerobacillus caldiproteolyticus]|uniref:YheC/YheD family endospore coat-associated protein n=1 Tax=Thermaerobacillus caldiproteolyticus TaxID=247480 RepID=UPI0018F1EB57|nr:YheC/YheD family protein [Anoxybacillus caldiproteolyticus]
MNHPHVIAVLTEIFHTESGVHFGSIHEFCQELAYYSQKQQVMLYVTSLPMYLENDRQGYCWIDGKWQQISVPRAHVIYNRIHSRKTEHSCLFEQLVKKVKDEHIPMFNHRFLHKWEVHQLLSNYHYLQPYLPKTELLTTKTILDDFLEQFPVAFIKPIHGSQGRNIFRIEKTETDFRLDYSTFTKDMVQQYSSTCSLFFSLKERIKYPVIIQQGLSLKTVQRRPVDFRLLCHRIHGSQWQVTSAIARIAQEGQFVANIARGGDIVPLSSLLRQFYDKKTASLQKNFLKELALEVANALANEADGLYGEFGIDLALDHDGKPWIIEVNTKPSKQADTSTATQAIRPSAKAIIHYCLSLNKQKKE